MQLCARLNDTHTYIMPPGPVSQKLQFRPGLQSRLLEGKVIVTAVDDRTLSSAGVVPGVEIVSVDGVPVEEHVQKDVLPYIGASTSQGREDAAYNVWLLAGGRGSSSAVRFRDASGAAFERSLVRNAGLYPSGGSAWGFEMLDGRIAYVKLNTPGRPGFRPAPDDHRRSHQRKHRESAVHHPSGRRPRGDLYSILHLPRRAGVQRAGHPAASPGPAHHRRHSRRQGHRAGGGPGAHPKSAKLKLG
jgi:hypothetical protein